MVEPPDIIDQMLKKSGAGYIGDAAWTAARNSLKGAAFERWIETLVGMIEAGASSGVVLAYTRISPDIASKLGASAVLETATRATAVASLAGPAAGETLLHGAGRAAVLLPDQDAYTAWLDTMQDLAETAPQLVELTCGQCETLLRKLDVAGLRAWINAGLISHQDDPDAQTRYFSLSDAVALDVLEQESSSVRLDIMERRLQAFVAGLWGIFPVIRPATVKKALHVPRRTSFDGGFIRCPQAFAGFQSDQAEALFKAAVSHIGAHLVFTPAKFEARALKPLQIALVSIIEDSRVELLAGRRYPGLLRLWRNFHTATPNGPKLAGPLMARLARALIDPAYKDDDPWVEKGRRLFMEAGPDWEDSEEIRRIGVLLGNDLGQMRIQFNPKTHVVQPPYRDDNLGIWDFGDQPPETADDPDVVHASARIQQTEDTSQPNQRQRNEESREAANMAARMQMVEEDVGIPITRQPEWDYIAGRERPDWVTVMEYQPRTASANAIDHVLSQHSDLQRRIAALITQARVSRPTRLRSQSEGDRLDLEACIQSAIDRKAGLSPQHRVYERSALLHRDLSVLVLMDISESTKDPVNGTATSVFAIERTATALLSQAMQGVGDPFAVHAFCSDGRNDLHYYRVKDFHLPYDRTVMSRLAGLRPGLSTRMGAALRQAGQEIDRQTTHRRLILIITDGEPSDIDVKDSKYLVEDARKAVQELGQKGIDVFCVGLDGNGEEYLQRIFGRRNAIQISRVESLPERLPMLYFRLTA